MTCEGPNGKASGSTTVTVTSTSLPEPCTSPKITDSDTGACINKSECISPKVVNGNMCESLTDKCVAPKITDSDTGVCINKSECISPKVVNGNMCEILTGTTDENVNACLLIEQNPLTFTDEEKTRLEMLLRKFYLVSSTLKTSEDIATTSNELDQQRNFVKQIETLTDQCYAQVASVEKATGGIIKKGIWVQHGNPWFNIENNTGGTFPYTNENEGYLRKTQISETEANTLLEKYREASGVELIHFNNDSYPFNTERILNIW